MLHGEARDTAKFWIRGEYDLKSVVEAKAIYYRRAHPSAHILITVEH
jgi:hypothetical protein